jgi:hypothetical protein
MRSKRNLVDIVILAIVPLIITLPLFLSNGIIASYDIFFHFVWSEQFHHTFTEGVLYPRWVDTPFGYGSPTFIFYAPLSFYVISLMNVLTMSHIMSIKIAICLSFFLSGLTMYLFVKKMSGQNAGLISGIFYQLIPFHISELFLRGSVASHVAFIWFPLILLFIREIFIGKKLSSIAFVSLAYAGLILTHLVSAFMFTFVMIGYGLYLFFIQKRKGLIRMFYAMAFGIGLSSVYLIPVIFERGFIHAEFLTIFNYRDNFLFSYKSLTEEPQNRIAITDTMFLVASFVLFRKDLFTIRNTFFVSLLIISLFLTTSLSSFSWKYIPGFSNLQFPWRWLIFSGLSVSVLAGNLFGNHKEKALKAKYIIFLPTIIATLIVLFHISFSNHEQIDKWRTHSNIFSPREYRPIWVKNYNKILPATEKVTIINGNGLVVIIDWKSNQRIVSTDGKTALKLKFSTFYYPGWKTKIDNKQSSIMVNGDSGSIIVEVPEGKHKVELIFDDTSVRYYAKVVSIISLIVVSSLCLYGMFKPANKSLTL